jgi:hypothetical protein
VQTFLPVPHFRTSADLLDDKRLGKQRVETLQVIRGLTVPGYGWRHHPAVKMWRGRLEALGRYGLECCAAWQERGYADTCAASIRTELERAGTPVVRTQDELAEADALPAWLGDEDFHRSHRAALVRKDPDFYVPLFPGSLAADPEQPYVWPVVDEPVEASEERVC